MIHRLSSLACASHILVWNSKSQQRFSPAIDVNVNSRACWARVITQQNWQNNIYDPTKLRPHCVSFKSLMITTAIANISQPPLISSSIWQGLFLWDWWSNLGGKYLHSWINSKTLLNTMMLTEIKVRRRSRWMSNMVRKRNLAKNVLKDLYPNIFSDPSVACVPWIIR